MKSGCVHVVEVDTTCVGSNGGLLLSGRHVDLICEDVVDEGSCDGEVESDHQLAEGLSVAANEHGHANEVGGKYCEDCQVAELIHADSQVSAISKFLSGLCTGVPDRCA